MPEFIQFVLSKMVDVSFGVSDKMKHIEYLRGGSGAVFVGLFYGI